MNFLVTGHTGFIGSYLHKELIDRGNEVYELSLENGNITNKNIFKKYANKNIDVCFHLAGISTFEHAEENPELTLKVNVDGTKNVFDFCKENNIKLVYTSSYFVNFKNCMYGRSKFLAEKILDNDSCILRLTNVFSESNKSHSVINKFTQAAKNKKELVYYNDLKSTRDYIYVTDVIDILVKSINKKGVFNIGSGKATSLDELIRIISNFFDYDIKIKFGGNRKNEPVFCYITENMPNFKPKVKLREGIKRCIFLEVV